MRKYLEEIKNIYYWCMWDQIDTPGKEYKGWFTHQFDNSGKHKNKESDPYIMSNKSQHPNRP